MRDIRYQLAVDGQLDNELTEDVAEIEVVQTIDGPTTFRIRFEVDICDQNFELVDDVRLTPEEQAPITVLTSIDGELFVIAHGIIASRQVNITDGGPGSSLEVQGQDRRIVANREQRSQAHEGTASNIVHGVLSGGAGGGYGFEVDVESTEIEYEEDGNTLNQSETDLEFVEKLAGRNGMRFWVDWKASTGPLGLEITEVAHFRSSPPRARGLAAGPSMPTVLAHDTTPVLTLNSAGGCSNVTSFELGSNSEVPNATGPIERIDPEEAEVTEADVPEDSLEPLGEDPPSGITRARRIVTPGGADEARVRNEAALNDAAWSVQATAEASVHTLGALIAPHQLVEVAGSGRLTSGQYFVKSVTHTIDPSDHKLKIELLRNALGAA